MVKSISNKSVLDDDDAHTSFEPWKRIQSSETEKEGHTHVYHVYIYNHRVKLELSCC